MLFSHEIALGILQFHQLNEKIMLRIEVGGALGALEIEGEPLLNPIHRSPLGQVCEKHQIQYDGCGQNAVSAKKIYFDLHGIPKPAIDINAVPTLFIVTPRGIIVDCHFMVEVAVQIRIDIRLKDGVQNREFALLFGFESVFIVQHQTVAVA